MYECMAYVYSSRLVNQHGTRYVHKYIDACIIITMVTMKVFSVATARGSDPTMLKHQITKTSLKHVWIFGEYYLVTCQ